MKRGYIIEFKRASLSSRLLGGLLKLLEPSWDGWGWHLAIAYERSGDGWYVLEATGDGTEINFYLVSYLERYTRNYQWLDKEPSKKKVAAFRAQCIGKKYDVAIYGWTSAAIIFRHYFNHPIPRLLDDRFDCWELIQEFAEFNNDPIVSKYDVVIITDVIKALKERGRQRND